MTTDDPDPIAAAAARYKRDDAKAKQSRQGLTELVLDALRQPDAAPTDIARRAEWTPAYVRKLARDNGISADPSYKARAETARARLIAAASKESRPAAVVAPQQVAETLPPAAKPRQRAWEPRDGRPLTDEEAKSLAEIARSRASDLQAQRLEQDAAQVGDGYKDFTVVASGMSMGLLTHDEVYAEPEERPVGSEEKTG